MSTFRDSLHLGTKVALVQTADLRDQAITSDKIANGAVTSDKLKDGAVTTDKMPDGVVTNIKIADGALTEDKFAPGTIDALQKMDFSIDDNGHLIVGANV